MSSDASLRPLAGLVKLETLTLRAFPTLRGLTVLGNLGALRTLDLYSQGINSLAAIAGFIWNNSMLKARM